MKYPQLKLDNQLCHRLYRASNSVVRAYRNALSELNLTYPQYVVMMALWEENKVTIAKLIEKTAIDGGAMTQILKKMADKHLVLVIQDDTDKRKKWVQLQPNAVKMQQQAALIPEQIRCQFPSIDEQEAIQLISLLDKLNADLDK